MDIKHSELIKEYRSSKKNAKSECHQCHKLFTRKSNLIYHLANSCKTNKNMVEQKNIVEFNQPKQITNDNIVEINNKDYLIDNFNVYDKLNNNKRGQLIGIYLNGEIIRINNLNTIDCGYLSVCKICKNYFGSKK